MVLFEKYFSNKFCSFFLNKPRPKSTYRKKGIWKKLQADRLDLDITFLFKKIPKLLDFCDHRIGFYVMDHHKRSNDCEMAGGIKSHDF